MISNFLVRYRNVTILIVLSSVLGPVRSVLLARILTINDFGTYSLALTVIGSLYPLLMFGQQRGIIRFFNKNDVNQYDWIKPIVALTSIAMLSGFLLINLISWFYDTEIFFIYYCLLALFCSIITELLAFIVISKGEHEIGLIIQRLIRVIITAFVICFFFFKNSDLTLLFFIFGSIHLFYGFTIYKYVTNKVEIGMKMLPRSAHKEGLYFFVLDIVFISNTYGINFIIGALLSIQHLGALYALFIILRVYEAFIQATDLVVMPSARSLDQKGIFVIILKNFIIGLILSILFLTLGEFLISTLYYGKFDSHSQLIPYICILGWLKIMDIIPSSTIGGMSNTKILKRYAFFNIALSGIFLPSSIYFIYNYELIGAVISLVFLTLVRLMVGFGFLLKAFRFVK